MNAKVCDVCGYVYEESVYGKFKDLPEDWGCPHCGSEADMFDDRDIEEDKL